MEMSGINIDKFLQEEKIDIQQHHFYEIGIYEELNKIEIDTGNLKTIEVNKPLFLSGFHTSNKNILTNVFEEVIVEKFLTIRYLGLKLNNILIITNLGKMNIILSNPSFLTHNRKIFVFNSYEDAKKRYLKTIRDYEITLTIDQNKARYMGLC